MCAEKTEYKYIVCTGMRKREIRMSGREKRDRERQRKRNR